MKVRVSMPGMATMAEIEDSKAGKVYKELASQLLGFGVTFRKTEEQLSEPGRKVPMEVPSGEATEPEPELLDPEALDLETGYPEIKEEPRGYSGFLYVKCSHCGKVKAFCTKINIKYYLCRECGRKTDLEDLGPVYINCECGRRAKYMTNMTDEEFEVNCPECGAPVAVTWNKKKKLYEPIRN